MPTTDLLLVVVAGTNTRDCSWSAAELNLASPLLSSDGKIGLFIVVQIVIRVENIYTFCIIFIILSIVAHSQNIDYLDIFVLIAISWSKPSRRICDQDWSQGLSEGCFEYLLCSAAKN